MHRIVLKFIVLTAHQYGYHDACQIGRTVVNVIKIIVLYCIVASPSLDRRAIGIPKSGIGYRTSTAGLDNRHLRDLINDSQHSLAGAGVKKVAIIHLGAVRFINVKSGSKKF